MGLPKIGADDADRGRIDVENAGATHFGRFCALRGDGTRAGGGPQRNYA
jgi:hypothetical protein